jgi:hypothetical protein
MIFFEKNKVLGVEANRVLNILEEIKKKTRLEASGGKTRGPVDCACVAHLSFCFCQSGSHAQIPYIQQMQSKIPKSRDVALFNRQMTF